MIEAELLRISEAQARLDRDLVALRYRDRERSRLLRTLDERLAAVDRKVAAMGEADRIAEEVTAAVIADRRKHWRLWHKTVAAIIAAVLLGPAIHDLVLWYQS